MVGMMLLRDRVGGLLFLVPDVLLRVVPAGGSRQPTGLSPGWSCPTGDATELVGSAPMSVGRNTAQLAGCSGRAARASAAIAGNAAAATAAIPRKARPSSRA